MSHLKTNKKSRSTPKESFSFICFRGKDSKTSLYYYCVYFVFNSKLSTLIKIGSMASSCILVSILKEIPYLLQV